MILKREPVTNLKLSETGYGSNKTLSPDSYRLSDSHVASHREGHKKIRSDKIRVIRDIYVDRIQNGVDCSNKRITRDLVRIEKFSSGPCKLSDFHFVWHRYGGAWTKYRS